MTFLPRQLVPQQAMKWQNISRFVILLCCLFIIGACQPISPSKTHAIRITFVPYFQGQQITCGQALSFESQEWHISTFAMFLSQFSLNSGQNISLNDNTWQSEQVALIKAVRDCEQFEGNMTVVGKLGAQSSTTDNQLPITNLSFTIGVPQYLNHQNPLTQPSPLNDSSMFWSWRNGYKFIRWDMQSVSADSWSFHLGSVGCQSPAMVRAPKNSCTQPNLIPVTLKLDPSPSLHDESALSEKGISLSVAIHLDEIFGNLVPARKNTCMFSGVDNARCQSFVGNLKAKEVFKQANEHKNFDHNISAQRSTSEQRSTIKKHST